MENIALGNVLVMRTGRVSIANVYSVGKKFIIVRHILNGEMGSIALIVVVLRCWPS
jgi:hypothetical protein